MVIHKVFAILFFFSIFSCQENKKEKTYENLFPTENSEDFFFLKKTDIQTDSSFSYQNKFGKYVNGYNSYILQAIDNIQSRFPDGGGYFIGIKAVPTESPIGYDLSLLGKKLLDAPRKTSYCSGSSYTAFIEALNLILKDSIISDKQLEIMRMQEANGNRREDNVKFWGNWNTNGFGTYNALVSYSDLGKEIKPKEAKPGDFMNISWKNGIGHSVIFLGWLKENDEYFVSYWSSQKSTNGLGLDSANLNKIQKVSIVRLIKPQNVLNFIPNQEVKTTKGDSIFLNKL